MRAGAPSRCPRAPARRAAPREQLVQSTAILTTIPDSTCSEISAGRVDHLGRQLHAAVHGAGVHQQLIEPFADYGFPAAHACAYGYVAYQTAYLKAHHPVEFMSAMLTSVKDDKDRKPFYLYACRLMGIEVLPPDVNESEKDFAPAKGQAIGKDGRSATGCRRCATWGRAPSVRSSTRVARKERSRRSATSAGRWSRRCSPSGSWRA